MDIIQTFYDDLATQYDKLFLDWTATTKEQAALLDGLFGRFGADRTASVLDCACGIGTQAIGLAALGYAVTGSDISVAELTEARSRAAIAVAEEMSRAYRENLIGTKLEVLFEEKDGDYFTGHAPNYVKVYAEGEKLHNEIREVTVTGIYKDGVIGK